jgi:hypothetical protein
LLPVEVSPGLPGRASGLFSILLEEVMSQRFSASAKFHRYRLEVVEAWPSGELKRTAMAAARAALRKELAFDRNARMGSGSAALTGRVF